MGSLQGIIKKYHMEKWFQRDNLIVLVLAGILLVIIALPTKEADELPLTEAGDFGAVAQINDAGEAEERSTLQNSVEGSDYEELFEYTEYLEGKLENTLTKVAGVGKVTVMITLEASQEQIVEKDETYVRDNTTESDSQGGSRTIYQVDSSEETIYRKEGTAEVPYVSKIILPKISGVVVVAQGAGQGTIKKSIVEMTAALFDIEVHKISVVVMEE